MAKRLIYFVFIISVLLMVILAIKNEGYANDDHITVIKIIFETGKIPEPFDCYQCYHPKLYHQCVAGLWHLFNVNFIDSQILVAQITNAIAGIITLIVIFNFIKKQKFNDYAKLICFSLIALNPKFIATFAQPSNDAFIILFGTLIIYTLFLIILKPKPLLFLLLIVFSILAGLSKINAQVLSLGVVIVLLIKIISDHNYKLSFKKGYLGALLTFIIIVPLFTGYFGGFFSNYEKYNFLFAYNTELGEYPSFFKETTFRRPGVKSVFSGYFTFRILDMIQHPIVTNDEFIYPIHRTSVWSQLYGRTHFLYFGNWPLGIWSKTSPEILAIGRVSLALGLIPTMCFLIGIFIDFRVWISALLKRNFTFLKNDSTWIFQVFFWGFIAFIIQFTLRGRDYSFIKIIYLFPGILAIIIPLLKGINIAESVLTKKKIVFAIFNLGIIWLLINYIITLIYLIHELSIA